MSVIGDLGVKNVSLNILSRFYLSSLICCSRVLARMRRLSYLSVNASTSFPLAACTLSLPSSMSRPWR